MSLMCRAHNAYLAEVDYGKKQASRDRVYEQPTAYRA